MKKNPWANVMILLGLLLLAAAAALAVLNLRDSALAGAASQNVAEELMERIVDPYLRVVPSAQQAAPGEGSEAEMPAMIVDRKGYVGVLEIPDLGLALPIAADWDYEQLRVSPCRFSGTAAGKDLILCAHNYSRHFGQLLNIDMQTEIYLTTVDGTVYRYLVANREILTPMDVEKMMANEKGDWALTLFTCTYGGSARCAVRCVEAET